LRADPKCVNYLDLTAAAAGATFITPYSDACGYDKRSTDLELRFFGKFCAVNISA
jgi:hypothetical protein